jgi:hypothetical protein
MSLLRFVVFLSVALPLLLIVGWPHPWWVTFLIALVAGGVAHGVEALVKYGKEPAENRAAEQTPADTQWELKMLLNKAIASEGRKEWGQALTLFQQVIQKARRKEDADLARQHIQCIEQERSHRAGG